MSAPRAMPISAPPKMATGSASKVYRSVITNVSMRPPYKKITPRFRLREVSVSQLYISLLIKKLLLIIEEFFNLKFMIPQYSNRVTCHCPDGTVTDY